MKFSFHTLGCKVNQFETNSLKEIVVQKGHALSDENPDVFVINTCTVTAVSDKKNIKLIRKIKKEKPNAIVAVCGCFAQISPEKAAEIEGVDIICGTDHRADVIDMCLDNAKNHTKHQVLQNTSVKNQFEILPISTRSNRTRELLKVQDGCNNFCSYCIIPYARGRSRSVPLEKAYEQTEILAKFGTKEIIITGIEIASYGLDIGTNIIELIAYLCKSFPQVRFRLGSLEPRVVTDEFCERLSIYENLNPHFHLSLQSGCDTVLKRMNRKYDTTLFYDVCIKLRKFFPNPSITTDLIVGFPSETEEEFEKTLDFIEKCQFSSMHVFPYSVREGTKAATMSEQIDVNIKNSRAKRATELATAMEKNFLQSFVGKNLDVIVESPSHGKISGHSKYHFAVECEGVEFLRGNLYNLTIFCRNNGDLYGKINS
ncbi:MAG: tRNA (N(6)-L-threonylcarbamoyladenosine(37)-C(2))-methylthiotransferase MtaB [Clostridia bacterium]